MSETASVNTAIQEYFATLSEQISAASRLKDAVNDLLEKRDEATKSGKGNLDEWDVLDQSYICIKLRNAFSEIDNKLLAFKSNLSLACKQKDKGEDHLQNTQSTSEEVMTLVLSIVGELHQYHRTVAECIAPIVEYSTYRERYPSKYEMKECSSVPITWKAVNEVNRTLRYGYGLAKEDLAAILSWMHGEDLSESARKTLNLKVDGLILTYKERLSKLDSCEFDVPVAYQLYPLVLQDVIKDCCSPVESVAATGQTPPTLKDDLETLIRREIPRVKVQISDTVYDAASPGKAFENTKQKMVAVRHLVNRSAKSCKIEITREQLDLFSLKVLATACIPIANSSARTAVLIAFGKANLIQVKPSNATHAPARISLSGGTVTVEAPSQWCLTEDNALLQSLCRDLGPSIATVDAVYKSNLDLKAEIQSRTQCLPLVRIVRCSGVAVHRGVEKKDLPPKGLRKRLSKATSKLFNRKSGHGLTPKDAGHQEDSSSEGSKEKIGGIDNLGANVFALDETNAQDGVKERDAPIPPPRPRRKARTKKKVDCVTKPSRSVEEAKHDPKWFSSCKKLAEPTIPQDEDNTSLSVASFEELKDVIDLLSGSSTSSLSLNQPLEVEKNIARADLMKRDERQRETEAKGKVSPSDSGIGSSMSVQSHPSLTSMSKLPASDSITGKASESSSSLVCSEKCSSEDGEQLVSGGTVQSTNEDCKLLRDNVISCSEQDSRMEDAEVALLNESAGTNDSEGEWEDREGDETPSNSKNMEFLTIVPASPDGMKSDAEDGVHPMVSTEAAGKEKMQDEEEAKKADEMQEEDDIEESERPVDLISSEATAVQDQTCYDADNSEDSIEDGLAAKSLSRSTLLGSSESLYFSTWTLDDFVAESVEENVKPGDQRQDATRQEASTSDVLRPDVRKLDETADSYFLPGLIDASSEEFQDCKEPDESFYGQFNPRLSWPFGLGDRLAAIWGEKEVQMPKSPAANSKEVWSAEREATLDRVSANLTTFDGSSYLKKDNQISNSTRSREWLHQRPLAKDSYQNMPTKSKDHWSGLLSVSNRHTKEMRQSDWGVALTKMRHPERGAHSHHSFQHVSIADVNCQMQQQPESARGWPSSASSEQWCQKVPRFQNSNFNRPSSVPDSVNRGRSSRSPVIVGHQGMDTFEMPNLDNLERQTQTSSFNLPSSNVQPVPAHFLNPSYRNWNRNVNSEPLLTATTKRSIAEYEALYMQQDCQFSRNASRNLPQQYRNHKW